MSAFLRKLSARKSDLAPAAAAAAAAAPAASPVDLPPAAEPFSIASLTPRDLNIKSVTSTEATLVYSLPPTSTKTDTVDVRVLVRPAKAYRETQTASRVIEKELTQLSMDHNMRMAKERTKPGFNQHEAFQDFSRKQQAVRTRMSELWAAYETTCKELLNMAEVQPRYFDGWYVYSHDKREFSALQHPASATSASFTAVATETNNTAEIGNLASNYFFELCVQARFTHAAALPREEGEEVDRFEWSPCSDRVSFSTKSAPWQSALEKAGLRQLIEPFSLRGYDSFASWLEFASNTELKMDLGIDSAMELLLQEILSNNGVITPAEQAKIDRERREMAGFVGTLLSELAVTKTALSMGDAVTSNKRFGVLTTSPTPQGKVSVRWEDARTKDPGNSQVEQNVDVATLQRTSFTLFMSHAQAEAQNQVAHLSVLLRDKDAKIWFDMDSERLEARDMVRGIHNSSTFLLYLTRSYLDRYFCRMELTVAKLLEKPLVIVYEPDERFGGTSDYVKLVHQVTQKFPEYREFLLSSEAIPMARRAFQRRAVVDEVCKRSGFVGGGGGKAAAASVAASAGGEATAANPLTDLHSTIVDLKMEINDLKADNKELREIVDALVKRLEG